MGAWVGDLGCGRAPHRAHACTRACFASLASQWARGAPAAALPVRVARGEERWRGPFADGAGALPVALQGALRERSRWQAMAALAGKAAAAAAAAARQSGERCGTARGRRGRAPLRAARVASATGATGGRPGLAHRQGTRTCATANDSSAEQTHGGGRTGGADGSAAADAAITDRELAFVPAIAAGVRPSEYRHPLDQTLTTALERIPGAHALAGAAGADPAARRLAQLELFACAVRVGPTQMPALWETSQAVARTLGISTPQVYVRRSPSGGANAYSVALGGDTPPSVVLDSQLLEMLTPAETAAVLAHEMSHLACEHNLWLAAARVLAERNPASALLPGVRSAFEAALSRWMRAAELSGDRAAVLVAGGRDVVVSLLLKISAGAPLAREPLSVRAFLEQARAYDDSAGVDPLADVLSRAAEARVRHPLPVLRAREIDRWSQSEEYARILRDHGVMPTPPVSVQPTGAGRNNPYDGPHHTDMAPSAMEAQESFRRATGGDSAT